MPKGQLAREDLVIGKMYAVRPPDSRRRSWLPPFDNSTDIIPVIVMDSGPYGVKHSSTARWEGRAERFEKTARGRHVGVLAPARARKRRSDSLLGCYTEYIPTVFMPKDFVCTWDEYEAEQVQKIFAQAEIAQRRDAERAARLALYQEILLTLPYYGASASELQAMSAETERASARGLVTIPLTTLAKIVQAGLHSVRDSFLDLDNKETT